MALQQGTIGPADVQAGIASALQTVTVSVTTSGNTTLWMSTT